MAEGAGRAFGNDEPQPPHTTYENYSGSHPIPTVQNYVKGLKERRAAEENTGKDQDPQTQHETGIAATELQVQEGNLDESRENKKKAEGKGRKEDLGGSRKVYDPVTGNREVVIEDASKEYLQQAGDPKVCDFFHESLLKLFVLTGSSRACS